MVYIAIISLVLGVLCAQFLFSPEASQAVMSLSDYVLGFLMVSVGVSVGMNKLILRKLREYNLTILLIPAGIMIGSVAGGFLSAPVSENPAPCLRFCDIRAWMVQPIRRAGWGFSRSGSRRNRLFKQSAPGNFLISTDSVSG